MADPANKMNWQLDVDQLVNEIQLTVYPEETVGALQVVWTARTVLRIAPGETRVLYALFRDSNGDRVAAKDVATLVASTDYTVNDQSDGGGTDYTSSSDFSISMAVEATRAEITMENSAAGPLYVTLLQVRGKPIRVYDPVVVVAADATSQTKYLNARHAIDLEMQSDVLFAGTYADYLVGRFATPALFVAEMVIKNRDVINTVNVFSLELLDRVKLSDDHVGASNVVHTIIGVEYDIRPGLFDVVLHLERADDRSYWLLGKTGYGELGSATRLGF